jgi:hypothetical protein
MEDMRSTSHTKQREICKTCEVRWCGARMRRGEDGVDEAKFLAKGNFIMLFKLHAYKFMYIMLCVICLTGAYIWVVDTFVEDTHTHTTHPYPAAHHLCGEWKMENFQIF